MSDQQDGLGPPVFTIHGAKGLVAALLLFENGWAFADHPEYPPNDWITERDRREVRRLLSVRPPSNEPWAWFFWTPKAARLVANLFGRLDIPVCIELEPAVYIRADDRSRISCIAKLNATFPAAFTPYDRRQARALNAALDAPGWTDLDRHRAHRLLTRVIPRITELTGLEIAIESPPEQAAAPSRRHRRLRVIGGTA